MVNIHLIDLKRGDCGSVVRTDSWHDGIHICD